MQFGQFLGPARWDLSLGPQQMFIFKPAFGPFNKIWILKPAYY